MTILCLNVIKTKEMVIALQKNAPALNLLVIKGEQVEFAHQYKYLGTTLADKLDWAKNVSNSAEEGKSTAFFFLEETEVLQG